MSSNTLRTHSLSYRTYYPQQGAIIHLDRIKLASNMTKRNYILEEEEHRLSPENNEVVSHQPI